MDTVFIGVVIVVVLLAQNRNWSFGERPAGVQERAVFIEQNVLHHMPEQQRQFVSAVEEGYRAYQEAIGNPSLQQTAVQKRASAICETGLGANAHVQDWFGTVIRNRMALDGQTVLTVRLTHGIVVKTWNNSISDQRDETMPQPGTPLFESVRRLTPGTPVYFSGQFFPHRSTCLRDTNLTQHGMMTSPEFLFRFRDIRPVFEGR